jgi:hypothetical protein
VRALSRVPRRSLVDVASCILPIWLLLVVTHTAADADLWGHLRFGADAIARGGLALVDRYSFTADTTWINHEWLAEVLLAACYAVGGAIALNLLKLAVLAAIGFIVWRAGRLAGGSMFSLIACSSLVVFASYTRTQVLRPQLFSVLFFAMLLALLDHRERQMQSGRRPSVALTGVVAVLFGLWTNFHGGWIVGFATLTVWLTFDVLEQRTLQSIVESCVAALAALAATLVNPYGAHQWTFLQQTVGLTRDISDWVPFLKLPPLMIAFELVLPSVAFVSTFATRRRPRARDAAIISMLAVATFRVSRIDAFLQIALGLLMAAAIVDSLGGLESWLRTFKRFDSPSPVHGLVVVTVVAAAIVTTVPRLGRIYIEGPWTPDAEAVRFLRSEAANTRLLTWFDWGEYAIWHLSPAGVQVSMDGRRETVYSNRVLDAHWSFYKNESDAASYPDAIGAEWIWLPKGLPVVSALRTHGWQPAFESGISVVLSRKAAHPLVAASPSPAAPAFFPGP